MGSARGALAAEPPPEPTPNVEAETSKPAAPTEAEVVFETSGLGEWDAAVRSAVAAEVERVTPPQSVPLQIAVTLDADDRLTVVLHPPGAAAVTRTVSAPTRRDELPELAALLAGNLARDQVGDLLATLTPAAPPPAPAEVPKPPSKVPEPPAPVKAQPALAPLPFFPVHLSVLSPLAIPIDPQRNFGFELSLLYGHIGGLTGLAVNSLIGYVERDALGIQISGLGSINGGNTVGVTTAGLAGYGGKNLLGASVTGLASIHLGTVTGLQATGVANLAGTGLQGAQVSGVVNVAGAADSARAGMPPDAIGLQAAGVSNVVAGSFSGLQAAGVANVVSGEVTGLQTSGAVNFASELRGAQIGVINIGGPVAGVQIGVLNIASQVTGTQIGVVNVAESVDGASIGVVPYVHKGRVAIVGWYDPYSPVNLGVRFQNGPLFFMPTASYSPEKLTKRSAGETEFGMGLVAGARVSIDRFFLDVDGGTYGANLQVGEGTSHHLDLHYRALAGVRILDWLRVFAGGGVLHRVQFSGENLVKPTFNAGLELL
jgi:hypothetical protein